MLLTKVIVTVFDQFKNIRDDAQRPGPGVFRGRRPVVDRSSELAQLRLQVAKPGEVSVGHGSRLIPSRKASWWTILGAPEGAYLGEMIEDERAWLVHRLISVLNVGNGGG
jgi:hypothetical protein